MRVAYQAQNLNFEQPAVQWPLQAVESSIHFDGWSFNPAFHIPKLYLHVPHRYLSELCSLTSPISLFRSWIRCFYSTPFSPQEKKKELAGVKISNEGLLTLFNEDLDHGSMSWLRVIETIFNVSGKEFSNFDRRVRTEEKGSRGNLDGSSWWNVW